MTMKLLMVVTVSMVVMLFLTNQASGECCRGLLKSFPRIVTECADCSEGHPYCGHGRCNMFGCHCTDGCKEGNCGRKNGRGLVARDVIAEADVDGDGRMSMEEARALLTEMDFPADSVDRDLKEMDLDNDNFLSPGEID